MKAPKIEFPCEYPIKVVGFASDTFVGEVLEVVARHACSPKGAAMENQQFSALSPEGVSTGKQKLPAGSSAPVEPGSCSRPSRPVEPQDVSIRDSRHGKYQALTFNIWATGEVQLKALHADLVARAAVKLVL